MIVQASLKTEDAPKEETGNVKVGALHISLSSCTGPVHWACALGLSELQEL